MKNGSMLLAVEFCVLKNCRTVVVIVIVVVVGTLLYDMRMSIRIGIEID